jgi:SAM-dependent methyltransferase
MSAAGEQRFAFGRNWSRFVRRNFTQERCDVAKKHILDFLGRESMEGLDFLDIGCGSGIHSLAAWQSGARRVHSFDYDPDSVAATKLMWQTAGRPSNWTIERGDVLDSNYIASLGKWNFVYSWGVLHHTGRLWQAVENAQSTVADGGIFYIALYSSDAPLQASPEFWLEVKQKYNRSGYLQRQRMVWWYVWNFMLDKKLRNVNQFVKHAMQYKFQRGMDLFTDIRDWLGGWPMEFAADQETVDFLEQRHGFALVNVTTGQACSEFLFRRSKSDQRALVKEFVARQQSEPVTA